MFSSLSILRGSTRTVWVPLGQSANKHSFMLVLVGAENPALFRDVLSIILFVYKLL